MCSKTLNWLVYNTNQFISLGDLLRVLVTFIGKDLNYPGNSVFPSSLGNLVQNFPGIHESVDVQIFYERWCSMCTGLISCGIFKNYRTDYFFS